LQVSGASNLDAATAADIVFVTVPFSAHGVTLEGIIGVVQEKVVVDVTVPLVPPKVARVQMPEGGSAGQIAQSILGDNVRVVSAMQNVAAAHLNSEEPIDCDVLVTGNNRDARQWVIDILAAIDMRGFHAGMINNAAAAEALTSVLIHINKQYKTHAGIRLTGIN
jgi:NADPH-dependent F420 reductase